MADWLAVALVIGLVVLAYVAGLATRPVMGILSVRLHEQVAARRGDRAEALEELQGLLVDLQRAGETVRQAGGDRRFLDKNLELSMARDRIANRTIREQVEHYQEAVLNLVELDREEASRAPLLDAAGEVSGARALERVQVVLRARQDAWQSMAQTLNSISDELRRL